MSRDDDLLERATRALGATPPPDDGELARAKMRMLAAHKAAQKKGNARTLRWVLPLAAVLAAGSALAAVPHGFERLAQAVEALISPAPKLADKPKRQLAKPAPKLVAQPAPGIDAPVAKPVEQVPEQPAPAAVATPKPRAPKRVQDVAAVPPPVVAPAPVPAEPAPVTSADLAKYRAAHKAHFQQRDFALALRNWEAYLRQFPSGTFAIEARYNRAICLLRLGRNDEARRALTPFAQGEIGNGYRRAEATKLLEALE
jgi:TolA-binding protein